MYTYFKTGRSPEVSVGIIIKIKVILFESLKVNELVEFNHSDSCPRPCQMVDAMRAVFRSIYAEVKLNSKANNE
jgi:hypothetical protein